MEQLPEVLPTVDPELGALVHAELADHGVQVLAGTTIRATSKAPRRSRTAGSGRQCGGRRSSDPRREHGLGRRRRAAQDHPGRRGRNRIGIRGAIAVDPGVLSLGRKLAAGYWVAGGPEPYCRA